MTSQVLTRFEAECLGCKKRCSAKNAQAWAHNHSRKTGHEVNLSLGWTVRAEEPPARPMFTVLQIATMAAALPKRRVSTPEEVRQRINLRREAQRA